MDVRKRIIALALSLFMLLAMIPVLASAGTAAKVDSGKAGNNVTWTFYDDGRLVFSGYGKMDDNQEHIIKPWSSLYASDTKQIIFEEGITYIGEWLLNNSNTYYRLESVSIPSTVSHIGEYAFGDLVGLRKVYITSMEKWCRIQFDGGAANPLSQASLLYLNGNLVEDYQFSKSVTEIGEYAFKNCSGLRTVIIPSNVKRIGDFAFNGCVSLEKIVFQGNAPVFETSNTIFTLDNVYAYYPVNNPTWNDVITQDFSGAVTWIGYDPATEDVASDAYPGSDAYGYTTWELDEETGVLTISGNGKMFDISTIMDSQPWYSLSQYINKIVVQEGVTYIGNNVFNGLNRVTEVSLPATLKSIGSGAFYGCNNLGSITLPEGLQSIGDSAFAGCSALKSIDVPNGIAVLNGSTFSNCKSLEKVELHEGLESIGMYAFYSCNALKEIVIPGTVTSIAQNVFEKCKKLVDLTFVGEPPAINDYAFYNLKTTLHYPGKSEAWAELVGKDFSGEITWDPYGLDVKFVGVSLSLKGDIGLNYYAELSDAIREDTAAYIHFAGSGEERQVAIRYGVLDESDGSYRFSIPLNAKNMGDEVTAQGYNADGTVDFPRTLSVKYYADYVIENDYRVLFINLMKAMLNYGAAAQIEFGYKTDQLVNADLEERDKVLSEPLRADYYAHTWSGEEEGLEITSASLLLQSQTKIRIYFKIREGWNLEDFVFSVDGAEVTPVQNGDGYYIEKANVAAKDLDTMYTFCLGGKQLKYCGLSYVNQVMENSKSENLRNLAKALYHYNRAANGYFWNADDDANLDTGSSVYVDEMAAYVNEYRRAKGYPEVEIRHDEFALVRAAELTHTETGFRPGFKEAYVSHWFSEAVAIGYDDMMDVLELWASNPTSTVYRNGITHIVIARNGDCWTILGGQF